MSELPKKAQDRVNTFGVVLIGAVAAVLLWVSVVALQAYYYSTAGKLEGERSAMGKGREVRDLKAEQRAYLQEGKYVDPAKGIVTIPIDDAMKLVLRDAKAGNPSLVPKIGPHDKPTVPAVSGRPPDNVAAPAAPAGADGAAPAAPAAPAAGATTEAGTPAAPTEAGTPAAPTAAPASGTTTPTPPPNP